MERTQKVLLCALNAKYIHSSLAPWYLLAGIAQYCVKEIRAELLEATVNEDADDILNRIAVQNPDVVAFSCYIWNIQKVKELIRKIKVSHPGTMVILGGPEVSYNTKEVLLNNPGVGYVISGEGEKPLALLLNAIYIGDAEPDIPGVCYRKDTETIISAPFISAEDPPDPYSEQYFKALNGRIAYLESSRGCPFSCAFCLSERGNVRYFDLEEAKERILRLAKSGTKTVKLVDRTFNANRKRAYDLMSFLIQNAYTEIPEGVCFHFEIAGDLLDEDTISLLASAPAGLIQLEIGLQSFNRKTLEAVNRKTDTGLIKRNIGKLLKKGNIHIHIDLIAGLPFEDIKSFAYSFNTAYALLPHMLQLGFLKLLHGAPMRENPEIYPCCYHKNAPYEVISTPWLPSHAVKLLHHTEDALNRLYNSGRFRRTLSYLLSRTGYTPFVFFQDCGNYLSAKKLNRIGLNDFIALVYDYFISLPNIEKAVLRDTMVCDFLSSNAGGKLPYALQIPDPALREVKKRLKNALGEHGVKRGFALLYAEPRVVVAEYDKRNPVTGEYKLSFF
ncbi:MAG: DUF4080 domain-containing protein [Clostridiales bacterium]|nr:DUF4080 domain-containing protein [Clostridiales bacterium]